MGLSSEVPDTTTDGTFFPFSIAAFSRDTSTTTELTADEAVEWLELPLLENPSSMSSRWIKSVDFDFRMSPEVFGEAVFRFLMLLMIGSRRTDEVERFLRVTRHFVAVSFVSSSDRCLLKVEYLHCF